MHRIRMIEVPSVSHAAWTYSHKYQRGLYKLIWGSAQVDFMLGSKLRSRKEHTHRIRMIEMPSVSHTAWTYCRTGKSFKMLKREGEGREVSRIGCLGEKKTMRLA